MKVAHRCAKAIRHLLCGIVILALTASCAVHIVSDYDPQIDSGLSELNTDINAFVSRMINAAGTPAGAYDANKDFYVEQEAKVDTLVLRAQAHKALNDCPSTELIAAAVQKAAPEADAAKYMTQIPKDDCSVVLLQLVKNGFNDLETFHKAQGDRGIPEAARGKILDGGVGALIRAAITVEMAKKTGNSMGE